MAEAVDLAAIAAAFGMRLRAAGIPVTPERCAQFVRAVRIANPDTRDALARIGRTTLLTAHEQSAAFDAVFDLVFRGEFRLGDVAVEEADDSAGDVPAGSGATPEQQDDAEDEAMPSALAAMSDVERLRERDFASCTEEELELIRGLIAELPFTPPLRRARRTRRHRLGHELDVRATLRRAHRTGGDPMHLVARRRSARPRRVVLLADVSGSMAPYARVYLHLLRGAVQALHADAFVFATRLTRLTRTLAERDPDAAYQRAIDTASDWSSGTRIGASLQAFIDLHGRRGVARGAVIVIVSDGWEIDDPAGIAQAMRQLHRLAHRVIWVNPRKATPGYAPLVQGMRAALPHVDTFVSGHSVNAVADVLHAIRTSDDPRPRVAP